ncbi:MAG: tRNA 4-thiouridine(8) synthase ThiI [Mycoplasmoidaceae bacterium]|nr:MAG: tRNA 4-thiouridine(8) synthase ThiI [Mycoplasmoidaceae bacterium]
MIVYIKYGELTLKGKNRANFVNCLYQNIKRVLLSFKTLKFIKEFDCTTVLGINTKNIEKILNILKEVSGISFIIKAYEGKTDLPSLGKDILSNLPKGKHTFKVDTKRSDKTYSLNSMDINCKMGGIILDNMKEYKVDVHTPEIKINIEIKKNKSIFYFEKIKGMGGLPLGINGKVLMLISGGIDSPVAAKLLIKKGFIVHFLTFITPPHTNPKALKKVEKLRDIITMNNSLYNSKLYICNFTNIQHELSHITNKSYQITLMRRYFFRIAKRIANENKMQAIATGESLGQVASQTIESMQTIQNAVDDLLVLRPLLTYDKEEIISLAKKFGTYDVSIEPYIDCCALFVPKNPATKPTIRSAKKLESELELIESLSLSADIKVK